MYAGAGIGFCQVKLVKRDNNMVKILPDDFSLQMETWVTMHENLRNNHHMPHRLRLSCTRTQQYLE